MKTKSNTKNIRNIYEKFRHYIEVFFLQVGHAVMQGRSDHYQIVGGKLIAKRNHAQDIKDLERTLKHPLYPDNAYFSLQHFNLFTAVPSCELHAMTLGFFQHLVSAIFYKYESVLRRPDLKDSSGNPLVGDGKLGLHVKRIQERLLRLDSNECIVPISSSFVTQFRKVFFDKDSSAKMTGDENKQLMVLMPFMIRDLITPEVLIYVKKYSDKILHFSKSFMLNLCFVCDQIISYVFRI